MKKWKKYIIILVIVIIGGIVLGIYNVRSLYFFNENNKISNGKTDVIEHIKSIENTTERTKKIDFFVDKNIITRQEADELY